jgi:hypothetical protein
MIARIGGSKRVWLLVGLLLAVALSGCVDDEEDDGPQGPGGDGDQEDGSGSGGSGGTGGAGGTTDGTLLGVPPVIEMRSCGLHAVQFFFPMEFANEFVPSGFEPVAGDPAGATALMMINVFECASASSLGFATSTHAEFRVFALVEPPAAYRNASADAHYLELELVVTNPEVAELYSQWGKWSMLGSVSFSVTEAAAARHVSSSVDDDWTAYEIETVVDGSGESCSSELAIRLFDWNPQVSGYVDLEMGPFCSGSGTGKVLVPEPWTEDPDETLFWLVLNGAITGPGVQMWGDAVEIRMMHVAA